MILEVEFEQSGTVTVAHLSGSIDGLTSETLSQAMSGALAEGRSRLIGDFARIEYVSSAGLRALLATLKEARRLGGDLRLAAVGADVYRVLDLSGFTSILKLYPDLSAAIASFGP